MIAYARTYEDTREAPCGWSSPQPNPRLSLPATSTPPLLLPASPPHTKQVGMYEDAVALALTFDGELAASIARQPQGRAAA